MLASDANVLAPQSLRLRSSFLVAPWSPNWRLRNDWNADLNLLLGGACPNQPLMKSSLSKTSRS